MKKGFIGVVLGFAGGYIAGKYGEAIIDKVKTHATNESFEQLLKELEKQKINLFKKGRNIEVDDSEDYITCSTISNDVEEVNTVDTEPDEEFDAELEEIKKLYDEEESKEYTRS